MRAVLLDGAERDDPRGIEIAGLLAELLARTGWSPEHLRLRELTINPCVGCFGCWTRTPGECRQDDDGLRVARAAARCDALVMVTRVRFGGYGSLLKGALDRMLCNLLPTIDRVGGEPRHPARYDHHPAFLVAGLADRHDPASEAIFETLVRHHGGNAGASRAAVKVLLSGWSDDVIGEHIADALVAVEAVV